MFVKAVRILIKDDVSNVEYIFIKKENKIASVCKHHRGKVL